MSCIAPGTSSTFTIHKTSNSNPTQSAYACIFSDNDGFLIPWDIVYSLYIAEMLSMERGDGNERASMQRDKQQVNSIST